MGEGEDLEEMKVGAVSCVWLGGCGPSWTFEVGPSGAGRASYLSQVSSLACGLHRPRPAGQAQVLPLFLKRGDPFFWAAVYQVG